MEGLVDTSRQRKLLILYLFIGNIAADCPIPDHGEFTVLTEESLLKHDFPDGTVIKYQCRVGHDKLSGTGEMTCVNGNWTEPDIICRRQDCGPPAAKPHMIFHLWQGTLYGAVATITCETGYRIIGWSTRICVGTRWIGKGNCTRVTCPRPTKVENGEHSWRSHDKPQYKQNIHFSCHKGYTLFGNKTITCTETGKYDFEHPQCIAFCPIPEGGENMILTNESLLKKDFPAGTEVTYECIIGYENVSGTGIMTCDDGNWTEPDIICKKKDCGPLKPQPHMIFDTSQGSLFGATVYVSCEKGYRLNGQSSKQCLDTGWSGTENCEIVTCPKPTRVENGRHSWNSVRKPEYRQTIRYTCNTGYTLHGNEIIRCTETAQYDSKPPRCINIYKNVFFIAANCEIVTCPKPTNVENGEHSWKSVREPEYRQTIRYTCNTGYRLRGNGIIRCTETAQYDSEAPRCVKKDCGLPPAKPHMLFDTSQGTLFGAVVTVTCEKGYRLNGQSSKQCLDTGWSGTENCEIVTCSQPIKVENGEHSWNSDREPEYRQTIHFTCNEGYTLLGNEIIRCTDTAEYDSEPPRCVRYCSIPKSVENMVLTNESLQREVFPEGTKVKYECANGFEKESGSEIITCIDGNWTDPDLICKDNAEVENFYIDHRSGDDLGNTLLSSPLFIFSAVCCTVGLIVNIICVWNQCSYDTGEERTTEPLRFHTL